MERKVVTGKKRRKAPAKKTTHRRRRGIRGVGDMGGMATKVLGLTAGAVAARELNTIGVKFLPSLGTSPILSGALQIAAGLVLPKLVKGNFVADMGMGMIANGGMVMIVSTGIISGAGDRKTYYLGRSMGGTNQLPMVAGTNTLPIVNGASTVLGRNRGTATPQRRSRVLVR